MEWTRGFIISLVDFNQTMKTAEISFVFLYLIGTLFFIITIIDESFGLPIYIKNYKFF